jgi:hypothetical protein
MARIIAPTAFAALGLAGAPVHEPVHARGPTSRHPVTVRNIAACRPPVHCRPLDPANQGQRLAARLRAARPARRSGPGRVALPDRRLGIPGGPGMGQVRRDQTRGGIRTGGSLTRRDRARPRRAAAGSRAGYDQAAGQAAPASLPRPGMPPPALAGNSATSNYSLRTSRSVPRPRRIQLARHSSLGGYFSTGRELGRMQGVTKEAA